MVLTTKELLKMDKTSYYFLILFSILKAPILAFKILKLCSDLKKDGLGLLRLFNVLIASQLSKLKICNRETPHCASIFRSTHSCSLASGNWGEYVEAIEARKMSHALFHIETTWVFCSKIIICWNNCSGNSKEKCFKFNLTIPKFRWLKKGNECQV